jgi:glycerophosphoryl diester phosphodiesterase
MRLIAHRGASDKAPENTLASLKEAFLLHADGAEFDLQMTKDQKIILLHDDTLERTTRCIQKDEALQKIPVQELTFDQIKFFDVGVWKDPRFQGEVLATLEQALDLLKSLPKNKIYFMEIKGDDFAIIPHLEKIIGLYQDLLPQLVFIGFGFDIMATLKKKNPIWKIFTIYEDQQVSSDHLLRQEIKKVVEAKLDGMDFEATKRWTKEIIGDIHQQGLEVAVWVSSLDKDQDTKKNASRCQEFQIDYFTSNMPEEILSWHKQLK